MIIFIQMQKRTKRRRSKIILMFVIGSSAFTGLAACRMNACACCMDARACFKDARACYTMQRMQLLALKLAGKFGVKPTERFYKSCQ